MRIQRSEYEVTYDLISCFHTAFLHDLVCASASLSVHLRTILLISPEACNAKFIDVFRIVGRRCWSQTKGHQDVE